MSVRTRKMTGKIVQIVRYSPLSTFPSGEVEWNTFITKSEYLEELAINVLFWTCSQTSTWARSCAYFAEPLVQMTTSTGGAELSY